MSVRNGWRCLAVLVVVGLVAGKGLQAAERPNIVWMFVDDMSPNFSCYGETTISTPNVDRLAREGTRFTNAYVTAPVCSPCRSALITGMYQTSIGAHNHRSGRGTEKIILPAGVEPVPVLFQRAGYYTCSGGPLTRGKGIGKTDYNFEWDPKMYDGVDWSKRKPGQPFFMQVQMHGGKYRHNKTWSERVKRELGSVTDPASVKLPPYYPDDPVIRKDWAEYLDAVRYTDYEVGQVLKRLEEEKILEETVVMFMTDHGISHARGKQFLYDEGIHVPFVIRGPGIAAGKTRDDLVEHIDMAALSLALAGIPIPAKMKGQDILATDYQPRTAVFAARDRCDETVERIRSVRTADFKYIRNFYPARPHLQPNRYKDGKEIVQRMRELHTEGKLDAVQEQLFTPTRPKEELYDLEKDPYEIHNLAGDPAYKSQLEELRGRLNTWMVEMDDHGRVPESAAMYDSDMRVYLGEGGGPKSEHRKGLQENIDLMKKWAAEGK